MTIEQRVREWALSAIGAPRNAKNVVAERHGTLWIIYTSYSKFEQVRVHVKNGVPTGRWHIQSDLFCVLDPFDMNNEPIEVWGVVGDPRAHFVYGVRGLIVAPTISVIANVRTVIGHTAKHRVYGVLRTENEIEYKWRMVKATWASSTSGFQYTHRHSHGRYECAAKEWRHGSQLVYAWNYEVIHAFKHWSNWTTWFNVSSRLDGNYSHLPYYTYTKATRTNYPIQVKFVHTALESANYRGPYFGGPISYEARTMLDVLLSGFCARRIVRRRFVRACLARSSIRIQHVLAEVAV